MHTCMVLVKNLFQLIYKLSDFILEITWVAEVDVRPGTDEYTKPSTRLVTSLEL